MKVLSINDREVTLEDFIRKVRNSAKDQVVKPFIQQAVIEESAASKGMIATTEELQEQFDNFRKINGLYTVEETERWMQDKFLTLDDLEKEIEINILSRRIKESFPREDVEKFFAENKINMDAVDLSIITVEEQEMAMEILAQIEEDEADFMVMAREYSVDEKAKLGGYIGIIQRPNLDSDIAAAVFGAEPGNVVGPFKAERGYSLIRVNAFYTAVLDEQKEKEIRNILFQKLITDQIQKIQVEWAV